MQDKLAYSEPAAAKLADIGRTKLREEIRSGRLTARRVGKRVIITATDLQNWLDNLPAVTPSAAA
jgi:excisionase family DNA binding protein